MAATFSIIKGPGYRTMEVDSASATTISAGTLVALDSGDDQNLISAVAASTEVAYTEDGKVAGQTTVTISVGDDFELVGTGDANFAASNKGTEVDITDAQLIDLGTSSTDVLKVSPATDGGTVGATTDIKVKINKPIF